LIGTKINDMDDFEQPKRILAKNLFTEPTRKNEGRYTHTISG